MIGRLLRDTDMREALAEWLVANHVSSEARILHEFKIPRPSARIDIALINGELTSFEIKSDVDSLSRLKSQIPACNRVFDRSYIVITGKHIRSCLKKVPPWWGIIIACEHKGDVFVSKIRQSGLNTEWCINSSLHLLTKTELLAISTKLCNKPRPQSLRHNDLVNDISSHYDPYLVRKKIRTTLKARSLSV